MNDISCNCIICAEEFNPDEVTNTALSKINITNFKICEACLNASDPADDYDQVKRVLDIIVLFSKNKEISKMDERLEKLSKL